VRRETKGYCWCGVLSNAVPGNESSLNGRGNERYRLPAGKPEEISRKCVAGTGDVPTFIKAMSSSYSNRLLVLRGALSLLLLTAHHSSRDAVPALPTRLMP